MAFINVIMDVAQVHRSAWPFLNPVDPEQVSDYYNIIKDPMGGCQHSPLFLCFC